MIDVHFRATEAIAGYQFTLEYPGLEVVKIEPGEAMQTDNFAVFGKKNALTTSFNNTELESSPEFTVQFRVHETGRLSELIHLSGKITPAEAYKVENTGQPMGVKLRFGPSSAAPDIFELLPCTPNPFQEQTTLGFRLPLATTATLRIFDIAGREVYTHTADYAAGLHSLSIP